MSFSPTDIAGITAWWDAAQVAGNDGDALGTVSDVSGVGRHLTQATGGLQPLLKKAANGINGQNVIRFDGSNDVVYRANTGIIQNVSIATFFIVCKATNTTMTNCAPFFISRDVAGSTLAGVFAGNASDGKWMIGGRRLNS